MQKLFNQLETHYCYSGVTLFLPWHNFLHFFSCTFALYYPICITYKPHSPNQVSGLKKPYE